MIIQYLYCKSLASFPYKTVYKVKPRKPSFICIVNKDQEKLAGLIYTLIYNLYSCLPRVHKKENENFFMNTCFTINKCNICRKFPE